MDKKILIVNRSTVSKPELDAFNKLGFYVVCVNDIEGIKQIGDMPLRDYFAAKAMQVMNANSDISMAMTKAELTPEEARICIVESAYKQADLMLKERDRMLKEE